MTLWGGRFSEPTDAEMRALQDSLPFDKRMYREDITGSIAYAGALVGAGILTPEEAATIQDGLRRILKEFEAGKFTFETNDEDIHTAVERRLLEIVGGVGGKLHTGRSRNDQVATDVRLWVMAAIDQLDDWLKTLQEALIEQSEQHIETLMPGYTHVQPAQPVTAAHWLMSTFWMLARDRERLADAKRRAGVLPLGSGALAGTPLAIDRAALAKELGFHSYSHNSLDGVSDRDFVAETLFTLALTGTHLSRLAEDIVWFSNPAFGYITLHDRYSTGSSLMPQKRNPDPMELVRAKTGRLIGDLTGLLTMLKGLPTGYNKDLQEDKEAIFDAFDTMAKLLPVVIAIIATLQLNPDKMRAALVDEMLATDLADYLVKKGMPFRHAHHVVGAVVRIAGEENVSITQLPLDTLKELSDLFDEDVREVFDFKASVAARRTAGGTAPEAVREQIAAAKKLL